ncbi:hypothetical protein D1224_09605 [Henriciella barbarensis]|uniref:Uncharacterized protein n=1 Tax=Henriciella barbarensis TaxID=86342 RepID=A0A399QZY2_9PROT|nr:hypothetical protein [Henriciella barbarensis]RIJ24468.1 hypothetical protein D1224_09605 [Henriciella barbarensis]
MLQAYTTSNSLLTRHLGSTNWSDITVSEQDELIKTFFKDQTSFETCVMGLDWKGDQNVGFVQVIELVRKILRKADAICEGGTFSDDGFGISDDDLLVVQVLINTQLGRRLAKALGIETTGASYDISDEELEHLATDLIEVEALCEDLMEFGCYDGAIEQVLNHLYPVYSSEMASFPSKQIQHLWKGAGSSSHFV